jgi:hypothetical protein
MMIICEHTGAVACCALPQLAVQLLRALEQMWHMTVVFMGMHLLTELGEAYQAQLR